MRHLAERWGNVTPAGVSFDLPLTHSELGRLVGARRPSITMALAQLAAEGLLTREGRGRWTVQPATEERFERVPATTLGY